jgi:hypothetical protein
MTMRRMALAVLLLLAAMANPVLAESNPSDVTADFNDGFADLAVGVPAENGVGAVNVLYGTAAGLSGAGGQLFSQVGGAVEGVDGFGSALAAGDFNNDDFADLAIGAPNDDVGSALDAGAVSVLYGSANGLTTQGGQLFTQVGGAIEGDDRFGSALAAGTSTTTALRIWPSALPARPSATRVARVRSACCTTRPVG